MRTWSGSGPLLVAGLGLLCLLGAACKSGEKTSRLVQPMRWWWVHPRPVYCRLEKVGTFQDWFDVYRLASQGLAMKEEIGDSQAVPVRAFVTLDPGGYFLEFDRFLDDGRNQRIIFFLNMEG